MSDQCLARLSGVVKAYKLFSSPMDKFLDATGFIRFVPWRASNGRELWALQGIDLELAAGTRIGIIGRNGAGKTTLLKVLAGNLAPTRGTVEVRGRVQALLDLGAGFHPDFTGYENISASLTYYGFSPAEIDKAIADIAEFTELGEFLEQPYKTYSSGMQARLAFATATSIKPDILIVDEILGAGDAYFLSKSNERMHKLVERSACIVLVSHALDQIVRFCDHAIWMERGRIMMRGTSLEVVKAYERHIRELDNVRLKTENRRPGSSGFNGGKQVVPEPDAGAPIGQKGVSRWPGEGSLAIERAELLDGDGQERALFEAGTALTLSMSFTARTSGAFTVLPVAVLYRLDGIAVSTHIGKPVLLNMRAGEKQKARLDYGVVRLGDGEYVFSVALYRKLFHLESPEIYDLIDRSYRFKVVGNAPLEVGIMQHSAEWTIA
jgi:lipopolysaccharide transport system ATP-binding protein